MYIIFGSARRTTDYTTKGQSHSHQLFNPFIQYFTQTPWEVKQNIFFLLGCEKVDAVCRCPVSLILCPAAYGDRFTLIKLDEVSEGVSTSLIWMKKKIGHWSWACMDVCVYTVKTK